MLIRIHYFFLLLFLSFPVFAEEIQVQVNSGTEISVSLFKTENPKAVILWIPTEYGIHGREHATAEELNKMGIEVWLVDLHSTYFMPTGRRSYSNIKTKDITDLIIKVSHNKQREVTLFATGRAAPLALQAARELQLKADTRHIVKSAILFHPNFYAGTAEAGKDIKYLPITFATNLALHIVQPSLSGKRYQLIALKEHLQQGGSDVTIQIINGVSDGFNIRQAENKTEEKYYKKTPSIINNAIKLLNFYNTTRAATNISQAKKQAGMAAINSGLQVYQGDIRNLYLNFKDLKGHTHTIEQHRGEVLLLNFWATWCPPCVKELPSLNRLQSKIDNSHFKILAINIGEKTSDVKKFLAPMSIKFPVLTDPQGKSVTPWKLIAFPSSFVIDKHGVIRYGLFGGLEWDNEEVQHIIQRLLKEK